MMIRCGLIFVERADFLLFLVSYMTDLFLQQAKFSMFTGFPKKRENQQKGKE